MLFALGLGGEVVGDTVYCNYPPAAQKIAKIGDVNTSYEKVLALRPDLIVADAVANSRAVQRLKQLRQPILSLRSTSLAGVERSLTLLGLRTGTGGRAGQVVGEMERKVHLAENLAARDKRPPPHVLIVVQTAPLWTAGAGTFLDDLVAHAGGVNVGHSVPGYGAISREQILTNPPDVILGDATVQTSFDADPILKRLPAVRRGRFYSLPADLTSRPGPRLADGLVLVAKALHGN